MKVKEVLPLIKVSNGYISKGLIIRDKNSKINIEDAMEREINYITSASLAMDESTIIIYIK